MKNLKLKGLDGVPYRPRGACPIIDIPRSTQPQLASIQPIYRRRQFTLWRPNSRHNSLNANTSGQGVANVEEEIGYIFYDKKYELHYEILHEGEFSSKTDKSVCFNNALGRVHTARHPPQQNKTTFINKDHLN